MCKCYKLLLCVFFVKHKTAYEVRISDWSSDVGSSDLVDHHGAFAADGREETVRFQRRRADGEEGERAADGERQQHENESAAFRIGGEGMQIGSASWRERVCQLVEIWVVA